MGDVDDLVLCCLVTSGSAARDASSTRPPIASRFHGLKREASHALANRFDTSRSMLFICFRPTENVPFISPPISAFLSQAPE